MREKIPVTVQMPSLFSLVKNGPVPLPQFVTGASLIFMYESFLLKPLIVVTFGQNVLSLKAVSLSTSLERYLDAKRSVLLFSKGVILVEGDGEEILIPNLTKNILGVTLPEAGATGPNEMQTVLFAVFAFSALFNAFNCREFGTDSILPNFTKNTIFLKVITATAVAQIFVTEVFSGFFNAVPLSVTMWLKIIILSSLIIVVNEVAKLVMKPFVKKEQQIQSESEEKIAA